ncbi:hypothetical protein D1831_08590 [Lactiplantibacillus garii]|uniref:LPXTG cell wall anchor domain-containing protein n=1 Tax=Lactiplantibacillus garii TaxID=2306423 RepID=A0A426D6Y8_9LACO|nr:MucBP domain-containing protein [Lactiplantibacillus garii]RRK10209.1 hypothetical protein D1831_08590 [Lactiplantibacillus garii]
MRLQKLQQIETISRRYHRQTSPASWTAALIILLSSASLGGVFLTQPVHASTPTTVAPSSAAPTLTTSAATSSAPAVTSSAPVPASATAATSNPAVATASASPSVTSATTTSTASLSAPTASAVSATAVKSTAASSSVTSTVQVTVTNPTSSAVSGSTSDSLATSSAPSSATSLSTSAMAAAADSTSAAIAAMPDTTVVTFGDSGIQQAVQTGVGVTGDVTLGDIRNYKGTSLAIGNDNTPLTVTGTLAGMQYLQCLPTKATISFVTAYNTPKVDLTPLIKDRFSDFSLMDHDLGQVDLTPLTLINPATIDELQLVGSSQDGGNDDYLTNPDGMTNAQLAQLGPWLTAMDATGTLYSINLDDNSLTDFAPLANFTKGTYLVAIGQRTDAQVPATNFVIGQPGNFTAIPLTGMQGEDLTSHYQDTFDGTATPTDGTTNTTLTPITLVSGHTFNIAAAYPAASGSQWFEYGFHGMFPFTGDPANYININYPNGTTFRYDTTVYQPANWQTAPSVTVQFVNNTTGQALKAPTTLDGTTIGQKFDLTDLTTPATDYLFDQTRSSLPTGTYTQDPQTLTFRFDPRAVGTVTVNYLSTTGQALAPAETFRDYVGDTVDTTPQTFSGYTTTTLPDDVTVTTTPTSVDYQYVPDTLQRTVVYLDTTTGKTLQTTTLSGPYLSESPYSPVVPISEYLATGYQLVADPFPSDGQIFETPTPTGTYTIELSHVLRPLTPGSTDLPSDADLQKTVTDTTSYQTTTGQSLAPATTQTVTFDRLGELDEVTGQITYGPWIATGFTSFKAVTAPTISGYQATSPATSAVNTVAATSPDVTSTITYRPTSTNTTGGQPTNPATSVATAVAPTKLAHGTPQTTATASTTSTPRTHLTTSQPTRSTTTTAQPASPQPAAKLTTPSRIRPATSAAQPTTALPQTSEQRPTTLIGWLLLAGTGLLAAAGRLFRRHPAHK